MMLHSNPVTNSQSRWLASMAVLIAACMLTGKMVAAQPLSISVSSMHIPVMERIAAQYKRQTGETVTLVPTRPPGALTERVQCLETRHLREAGAHSEAQSCQDRTDITISAQDWRTESVRPGGSVIFAIAQIALWSPDPALIDPRGNVLQARNFDWIAAPSPESDPFGKAAFAVLIKAGVLNRINHRLLYLPDSQNVYASILSGQTRLGFIALPQVWRDGQLVEGSLWIPPLDWYPVIAMTASLAPDTTTDDLRRVAANRFLRFLLQKPIRQILLMHGYLTPAGLVSS
ncbi:substrate-binding domain-containing protein [Orrella marina]|uniref:Molybdate ABC transporter substrate-binding protein n=1 Tax=Orrella marina TaxID=2163011 RepID=A0A2R4XGA4_9BURK|nr:substrate-binding domain-containing protein [Orrella marina]AWB32852.1 hypothetical protein DBV39_02965 [Orrella marina]